MNADYEKFLNSNFWRLLRKEKIKLSGRRCSRCGARRPLQCHHVTYPADWYDTVLSDLMVVCRTCHQRIHGVERGKRKKRKAKHLKPASNVKSKKKPKKGAYMPFDLSWLKAHRELFKHDPYQPKYQKPFSVLLVCENEFFKAVATWEKRNGMWKCLQADTVIGWMKRFPRDGLKLEMIRLGMTWKWISLPGVKAVGGGEGEEFERLSGVGS